MENTCLGLTYNNYGRKYGVISTNLSGPEILEDENLVANSLIVSSPTVGTLHNAQDNVGEQISHAMFFTDYQGKAARLTYTILPGNGLVVNAYGNNNGVTELTDTNHPYSLDTLTLEIDKDSLKTISSNGQLHVSKPDIIDNYTLMVTQQLGSTHSYISVVTANLEKATDIKYGIVRGDNSTISATDGILNVNTQNLDYVDDTNNIPGIVRPNPDLSEDEYDWRTIEANNGVLRVLTYNLDRATTDVVGVVKPEGVTTYTHDDGQISVITAGLDYATETTYGIVRPDNHTIQFAHNINNEQLDGVLYANSRYMAPTSYDEFGVIKLDSYSFGIDATNTTFVNRYPEVIAILDRYLVDYTYIINWLIDHENRITALEHQNVEMIASFNNYGTTITTLDMPVWDPNAQVVHSEEKFYSVQFSIVTNCKFHISVEYQNNVAPGITLHRVKMGDNPPVSGSGLSNYMFESTNMNENTLNFEFLCNNYEASTLERSTPTTVFITVSSINDASVYRSGAHVFNRWNMTTFIEPVVPEPVYTQHEVIEYFYEADGTQNKDLYFLTTNGHEYDISKSITMSSINKMSSSSFKIVAEEKIKGKRKTYYEVYKDGVYAYNTADNAIIEDYNDNSYTNYLPLSLDNNSSRSPYALNATPTIFYRDALINDDNYGWIADTSTNDNAKWYNYFVSNISSNTIDSANNLSHIGYNIFEIMSTKPISTNDRKLSLKLDLTINDVNDYSDWKNTELTIDYIEDIIESDMSVSVTSTIPSNTRTTSSNNINEVTLLELNFSRTDNVEITDTWGVWMQYCFNSIDGTVRKNNVGGDGTNKTIEPMTTDGMNYLDSISTRTSQNQTDETGKNLMNMPSTFNKILVTMPSTMTETTVSVKLEKTNDTWNVVVEKDNDVTLKYYDDVIGTESFVASMLVPQSVIEYMKQQVSIEGTEVENIVSGFKIINCILEGSSFATNNSQTARINANISWESYGIWPTHIMQQNNQLSFGNAFINNITINRWDDSIMEYEFKIIGGDTTNIPVGAQIETVIPYGNINPTIIMHYGTNSFIWNDYYDHIIISNDNGWLGTSTKIKVRLCNIPPVAPDPNSVNSWQLYTQTEQQQQVYDRGYNFSGDSRFTNTESTKLYLNGDNGGDRGMSQINMLASSPIKSESTKGTDNQTLNQHQQVSTNHPMIENIDGLRFNFVLLARYNDQVTTMNFAADLGQCTEKITFANPVNYNTGVSKDYTVVNAFYNNASHTSGINSVNSSTQKNEEETLNTISYLVNKIEQMSNTIQELTDKGNNSNDGDSTITATQSGKGNVSNSNTTR